MEVQSRVVQYIKETGIRQSFIAKKAGLSDNAMSLIFHGRRKMSADEFVKVCQVIGKTPNDFMEVEETE